MDTDLQKQVEMELSEIKNAIPVQSTGYVQRCHFCGQLAQRGSTIQDRFRGECCGG